jgi:hypothetical protein
MALIAEDFFDSDAVGAIENITLKPIGPATITDARIGFGFFINPCC